MSGSNAQYVKDGNATPPIYRQEKYLWKGEGPEPPKWRAEDGTIVYRSYEDYCRD